MNETIQWIVQNPSLITAIATAVLAGITFYYAFETRKMRIQSAKPFFTLRPGFPINEEPMELYLMNNGGLAKDISIDVSINDIMKYHYFVAAIPNDGYINLNVSLHQSKNNKDKINVKIKYGKSYGLFKKKQSLDLDYNELTKGQREVKYYYTSIENKLISIANRLTELHNDAEHGKFKSDNITVFPQEKPTRGNRRK